MSSIRLLYYLTGRLKIDDAKLFSYVLGLSTFGMYYHDEWFKKDYALLENAEAVIKAYEDGNIDKVINIIGEKGLSSGTFYSWWDGTYNHNCFMAEVTYFEAVFAYLNYLAIRNGTFPMFDIKNLEECSYVKKHLIREDGEKYWNDYFKIESIRDFNIPSCKFFSLIRGFTNKDKWMSSLLINLPVINTYNVPYDDIFKDEYLDKFKLEDGLFSVLFDVDVMDKLRLDRLYRDYNGILSEYKNTITTMPTQLSVEGRYKDINFIFKKYGLEVPFSDINNLEECHKVRIELIRPTK